MWRRDDMSKECERIAELLPDHAAGAGSPRQKAYVNRHVDACPACARELQALRNTDELLAKMELEPAPDLWDAIRPNLQPRPARSKSGWFARHWLRSTAATAVLAAGIAAWMITTPNTQAIDQQTYLMSHASMSWREPFADRAGLGLIQVTATGEKR
jgi:anti-sigma factor RsiW